MTITAFDGLTPPSTDDPTNFDTRADAFLAAFQTFQTQANALEADLNNLVSAAYTTSSATSLVIGTGSKSFTVQTGLGFIAGQSGVMASAADPTNRMIFTVTSYNSTTGAMVVNVTTIAGSGTHADWVVGLAPTGFAAGQTPRTTTNDDAQAGNVGEYVSSNIPSASAVSLVSATDKNVTSISLTAGDWDVEGLISFSPSGSPLVMAGSISLTSNTRATISDTAGGFVSSLPFTTGGSQSFPLGVTRLKLAATTTVYLVAFCSFPSGTCTAYGYIRARPPR